MGVKPVERDYIAKMIHYMCCNLVCFRKECTHYIFHAYGKVIKSYITDIDAREFKEFDDELM